MSSERSAGHVATIADFLDIPEGERRHELINGEIVEKASPSGDHGCSQAELVGELLPAFGRGPGGRGPGGWWFGTEIEVRFGDNICRPDIVGWRRDKVPERPRASLVRVIPDWICEILSSSNRRMDLVRKKRIYYEHHVSHYWILDPDTETLAVHRWHPDGYTEVLAAERGETVRAEPFEAHELPIDLVFGR